MRKREKQVLKYKMATKGETFEKKTTFEDRQRMAEMKNEGKSLMEIARFFNVDHTSVIYFLRKMNCDYKRAKRTYEYIPGAKKGPKINYLPPVIPANKQIIKTYKDYLRIEQERNCKRLLDKIFLK